MREGRGRDEGRGEVREDGARTVTALTGEGRGGGDSGCGEGKEGCAGKESRNERPAQALWCQEKGEPATIWLDAGVAGRGAKG